MIERLNERRMLNSITKRRKNLSCTAFTKMGVVGRKPTRSKSKGAGGMAVARKHSARQPQTVDGRGYGPHVKKTNGCCVRFAARHRIQDGYLNMFLLLCTFPIQLFLFLKAWYYFGSLRRLLYANFAWCESSMERETTVFTRQTKAGEKRKRITIVSISDTHNMHERLTERLPKGDILTHTGDASNWGNFDELKDFADWFAAQPYRYKIYVPGNHDMLMDQAYYDSYWEDWCSCGTKESTFEIYEYMEALGIIVLADRSVDIEGYNFHGSPWVLQTDPWATAFSCLQPVIEKKWAALPKCDVLLTHNPPFGAGDRMTMGGQRDGCIDLKTAVLSRSKPFLHVFGHQHGDPGIYFLPLGALPRSIGLEKRPSEECTTFCNASLVSDTYKTRKPVVIRMVPIEQ